MLGNNDMLRKLFFAAFAVFLLAGSTLFAQSTSPSLNIPILLDSGDYAAARTELGRRIAGRPDAALFAAHLEALILLRKGQPDAAADVLRQILDVAPDFEPARRELTVLLALMGQTENAIFHAERLLNQTDDLRIQRDISEFIRANRNEKMRGVSARFAILPSTNANKGSDEDTITIGGLPFTIDPDSQAKEGLGIGAGLTAWNSWRLSERWTGTLIGAFDIEEYLTDGVSDEQNLSLRFDFGRKGERTRLSFGPVAELRMRNWNAERKRLGLRIGIQNTLGPRTRVGADLTGFRQTYQREPFRDGSFYSGSIGLEHAVSQTLVASASLPFTRERTKRAHLDHDDIGLTLGIAKEWPSGLYTRLSLGLRENNYIGNFPGTTVARNDVLSSIGVSIKHNKFQIGRLTPEVGVVYTDSNSNVGFFDYQSLDFSVGFGMQF